MQPPQFLAAHSSLRSETTADYCGCAQRCGSVASAVWGSPNEARRKRRRFDREGSRSLPGTREAIGPGLLQMRKRVAGTNPATSEVIKIKAGKKVAIRVATD